MGVGVILEVSILRSRGQDDELALWDSQELVLGEDILGDSGYGALG